MSKRSSSDESQAHVPDPEDSRKPGSLGDLKPRSWLFVLKKTMREFSRDQCTDQAAALTYYAVLAIFPALIAMVSLLGVVGQGAATVDALMKIVDQVGSQSVVDTLRPTVEQLSTAPGAGIALIAGLAGALWSASGYVGAFGRAMNRVYEIGEGRPIWKLRPVLLLVTLVAVVLVAVAGLAMVLTGPVAKAVGQAIGLGTTAVLVWDIAKWPFLLAIIAFIVAMLYYATPNVQQPKFRWISVGAVFAIVVWILASAAFALYLATFANYNKTYGSMAGVIVFLLWLWLTNLALLLGAELDAELERGRELQAGIEAEDSIQLPARDTRNIAKAEEKRKSDVEEARDIRDADSGRRQKAR
jgi:membrane protein